MKKTNSCRWDELRAGDFSDNALDQRIDGMRAELGEAQARNFVQWPILNRNMWVIVSLSPSLLLSTLRCLGSVYIIVYNIHYITYNILYNNTVYGSTIY